MLAASRPGVLILRAAMAIAASVSAPPSSLGQEQPPPSSVVLGNLFIGDSLDINPEAGMRLLDAARQARAPGDCPLGSLTIVVPDGDPIFQDAVVAAQRDAALAYLDGHGIKASRVFTHIIVDGEKNNAWFELDLDREAPTLTTTSVPDNGSRVKPGDEITLTLAARDEGEPKRYQTGIKTLQLVADSEGGRYLVAENYEPCAEPSEHQVRFTYVVPSDAPPVVRLSTLTDDHAGHTDTDAGEFPLTDWYGRLEWSYHAFEDTSRGPDANRSETKYDGYADIGVNYDGQGNLVGTLFGSQKVDVMWWGFPHGNGEVCSGSAPYTPVTARVLGSYTPGTGVLSLHLVDIQAAIDVPWSGGGYTLDCSGPLQVDSGPTLSATVSGLQSVGDGTYASRIAQADSLHSFSFSMILKPAPD